MYINRTVRIEGELFSQSEILVRTGPIIVLAEPGAGKTELLNSIASDLSIKRFKASLFRHSNHNVPPATLIIDGLDEVAKIDHSAIDSIIVKAADLNPSKIVFSCRAAQWEDARTHTVTQAFGSKPTIVYLSPFDEDEQRSLISSYRPEINFDEFKSQALKIDISVLFGNPQMLKIFADAYIQSGGKFVSKQQIFADAVEKLASEKNSEVLQANRPSNVFLVSQAAEVFCKMLLSGCAGVSSVESNATKDFPYLWRLVANTRNNSVSAIETGLFRPSDAPAHHEPIHRIIAEYLAAKYLVGRIQDPTDRLSLKRVLSLIAPNKTPRDELRGLLAWMATEGDQTIEQSVIDLDPYAIFSNGDPAQLSKQSKVLLLERLALLAEQYPHFRGSDRWRDFSVAGFFTADVTEAVAKLLADNKVSISLKDLLLQLLAGTPAVKPLQHQLLGILLSSTENEYSRHYALSSLLGLPDFDFNDAFNELLKQNTKASLSLAAELIEKNGVACFGREQVAKLLEAIDHAYYPKSKGDKPVRYRDSDNRYFISRLIRSFDLGDVVAFLDALSTDLKCDCQQRYDCSCRKGRSHLIGRLLDRLFELDEQKPTAEQIWRWTKELRFEYERSGKEGTSITALQNDDLLRQEVQLLALGYLTQEDEIWDALGGFNLDTMHSGLRFRNNDVEVLVNYAFENDNVVLWSCLVARHRPHAKGNFENPLRAHTRSQSRQKPAFGRVWAHMERAFRANMRENGPRSYRRNKTMRRHKQRENQTKSANQKYFDENTALIESGQDYWWLRLFAEGYLHDQTEFFPEMEDKDLPTRALLNSFDFLLKHTPSLQKIGENSGSFEIVMILNAATLAHFRKHGDLTSINTSILEVVRTDSGPSYFGGSDTHLDTYYAEINRRIFGTKEDVESFLRRLIEPQIADPQRQHTNVGWLGYYEEFHMFRENLPIEWLERFPEMHLQSAEELFKLAATHGDRNRLRAVVASQIKNLGAPPDDEELLKNYNKKRDFWFLRQFFIMDDCSKATISWLQENKDHLLAIHYLTDRSSRDTNSNWRTLSARKVQVILDIFFDKWPKVHLPNSWGTGDPPEQTAYRFLTDVIWKIASDEPSKALPVLDALLADPRFVEFESSLKTQRFETLKKLALQDYSPPTTDDVVNMLDNQKIATVEDLRALLLEMLDETQSWLKGSETDPANYFYDEQSDGTRIRVDENTATKVIADRLKLKCEALGISVSIETHMHEDKRCDLTLTSNIAGINRLLVVEAKGQWHRELYTAAVEQLEKRYAIHPNASDQGVYLVYYFGKGHPIAGVNNQEINSAAELQESIVSKMPEELRKRIDVFVLDVSLAGK